MAEKKITLPNLPVMSDEEIQRQADAYAELLYGGQMASAKENYDREVAANERLLSRYRAQYEQDRQNTQTGYAQQQRRIEQAAVSRGMGRSSYVMDALRQSDVNLNRDLAGMMQDLQARSAEIDDELGRLLATYNDTNRRLSQERGQAIVKRVGELTQERYDNEMRIKQFEAQLLKAEQEQQRYEEQMALEREKFDYQRQQDAIAAAARAASSSGRGGGSSRGKSGGKTSSTGGTQYVTVYTSKDPFDSQAVYDEGHRGMYDQLQQYSNNYVSPETRKRLSLEAQVRSAQIQSKSST